MTVFSTLNFYNAIRDGSCISDKWHRRILSFLYGAMGFLVTAMVVYMLVCHYHHDFLAKVCPKEKGHPALAPAPAFWWTKDGALFPRRGQVDAATRVKTYQYADDEGQWWPTQKKM